tara:strand:+ start:400 stop:1068 length:669 start_codon:yes stop_codon:yes gene_type:complete
MKKITWLAMCLILLSSCSVGRVLRVKYDSVPRGAVLVEKGKRIGVTPVTLRYNLNDRDFQNGRAKTSGIEAYWSDGSRTKISSLNHNISGRSTGKGSGNFYWDTSYTFIKPKPSYQNNSNQTQIYQPPRQNQNNAYSTAKQEFNAALAAYEEALERYDNAKNANTINSLAAQQGRSEKGLMGLTLLAGKALSHGSLQARERELMIARERLEEARAKLRALTY